MAASKYDLDSLHALLAQAYKRGIEADMDDGVFNPALLSAAGKFLKDNEITADVQSTEDLQSLRDRLKETSAARRAGTIVSMAQRRAVGDEP